MRHAIRPALLAVKSIVDLNEDDSINSFISGKQMSLAADSMTGWTILNWSVS